MPRPRNPVWTDMMPGRDLDHYLIGSDQSPGQCTILKAPNIQRWQERTGNGQSGATLVPMGEECNDVEIGMYFWLPSQLDDWEVFAGTWFNKAVVSAQSGTTKLALSIYHPILQMPPISVTKVVYVSCTALEIDEYDGWSCTVTFKKYRPPILAPSRPLAAIPPTKAPPPTAQDQAQALIQLNQDQIAGLGNQLVGAAVFTSPLSRSR